MRLSSRPKERTAPGQVLEPEGVREDVQTKACKKCKAVKPVTEFYRRSGDKYHARCKPCFMQRFGKARANYRKRNWRKAAHSQMVRYYGISLREVELRSLLQEYRCPICLEVKDKLSVDHDHRCCDYDKTRSVGTCGKCLRGLICEDCNIGLGELKDSIPNLRRAIAYLNRYSKKTPAILPD